MTNKFVAITQDFRMGKIQMIVSGSTLFVLFFHVHFGTGSTIKTKRCVEHRVQDGRWNKPVLRIRLNTTEGNCLLQCVRDEHCNAYNFWHVNGTCELLRGIGKCGETEKQNDCAFVSIGDCTKDMPWTKGKLDRVSELPCLRWQYFDYIAKCPATYLRAPAGDYCVTLIPQKGLYLPGWHKPELFRYITLDGTPAWCRSGYLLEVASNCSVVWRNYTAGDLVPERAVVGGKWKNGTPLYIVADHIGYTWNVGYYHPSVQMSFIFYNRNIYNRKNMKILLLNWKLKIASRSTVH